MLVSRKSNSKKICSVCLKVAIPTDPVELSFWVAMNLPIDDAQRLKVLEMDCAVPRLRMELSLLRKVKKYTLYFLSGTQ